jgi:hypothetical protein
MGGELKKGDAIEVFVPDIVVEAGISPHWEHAVFERRNPAGTICALMADGKFRAFGVEYVRTQTPEPTAMPEEYRGRDLVAMARALDRYESSHGREAVNVDARFLEALCCRIEQTSAEVRRATLREIFDAGGLNYLGEAMLDAARALADKDGY